MSTVLVAEDDRPTRVLLRERLKAARFTVTTARDGVEALAQLKNKPFDLMLLDIWMPRMNGLEVLARLRQLSRRPKVVVMTSDNTPETLLRAIQEQAYRYISKPVEPKVLIALLRDILASSPGSLPIEVLSARPDWVELLVPCAREAAARIESFLGHLDADLEPAVRESVGQAFRELLLNAIEWGGRLDPNRKVRIAYVRGSRMLMYRIADPGPGFRIEEVKHAAVGQPPDRPIEHMKVREAKGLRPGGFGILMAKAKVDELIYNEARNEVVFVKYLA